jgi:hypothetical protein
MPPKSNCLSKTLSGRCCKNKKMKFSDHCMVHTKKQECIICCECISSFKKLNCGHYFCKDCIFNWLDTNNSCPCCRTLITLSEYLDVLHYSINLGNTITVKNTRYYIDPETNNEIYLTLLDSDDYFFENNMYGSEWTSFKNFIINSGLFSQFLNCHEEYSVYYLKMEDYTFFNLPPYYIQNGRKYLDSYTLTCY